jgi:transcriptional regulator with XRE-family HTH domain
MKSKKSKIHAMRERSGLSIVEVARKMNVTHAAVSKWDKGAGYPRADSLPKLAKVLGCSVSEFF